MRNRLEHDRPSAHRRNRRAQGEPADLQRDGPPDIEYDEVGHPYVRQGRVRISGGGFATPEGLKAFKQSLLYPTMAFENRIEACERWAMAVLAAAGLPPPEPVMRDGPYTFEWKLRHERRAPEWYAYQMLLKLRNLRGWLDIGNAGMAADLAWHLAALATEAFILFAGIPRVAASGGRARARNLSPEVRARHAAWQRAADEVWRDNPGLSKSRVAKRLIGKGTVRGVSENHLARRIKRPQF
jgi:hypothetical protein